ncbi:CYTH domain-containing protein [Streptomyces sp. NPDC026206]|uniref:CYTH domain-containing protein n=1 Tax=Streptomyces sp. NPDC026206 TaxID=3157089 RepID=UPI0033C3EF09
MPMEIERKFTVRDDAPFKGQPAVPVRQGYLARGEREEVRVRRVGDEYSLTVKKGSGLERQEFETSIDAAQFDALWPATEGCRVSKSRRLVPLPAGRTAHVDVFEGRLAGLVTVEVEFEDREEALAFVPPAWFGTEVTDDGRYANKELSSSGIPS